MDTSERAVVRKLDRRVVPLLVITNALNFLDKSVFSVAVLYGMGDDLGLVRVVGHDSDDGSAITDTSRYSLAAMIVQVGIIVGAYPWSLLAQKLPKGKLISVACLLWSLTGLLTPVCTSFAGVMVNRFFLGVFEGGLAPVFSVYICNFWTREEQVTRSGAWYASSGVASVIGPPLAACVGLINHGRDSWRYMYYIICGVSLAWSFVLFFCLPDGPTSAGLSGEEKEIAMLRLKESPTATLETRLSWPQAKECIFDHNVYFLVLFAFATSCSSLNNFAPLIIDGFGFTQFETLCLVMPLGAVTVIGLLTASFVSRRYANMRYYSIFTLLFLSLAGSLMCWRAPRQVGVRYTGLCLIPLINAASGMAVGLTSSNVAGSTKKYIVGSCVFMSHSLGAIVSALLFGASPAPRFDTGFISCTCLIIFAIALAIGSRWALERINKSRDGRYTNEGNYDNLTDKQNKTFRYLL